MRRLPRPARLTAGGALLLLAAAAAPPASGDVIVSRDAAGVVVIGATGQNNLLVEPYVEPFRGGIRVRRPGSNGSGIAGGTGCLGNPLVPDVVCAGDASFVSVTVGAANETLQVATNQPGRLSGDVTCVEFPAAFMRVRALMGGGNDLVEAVAVEPSCPRGTSPRGVGFATPVLDADGQDGNDRLEGLEGDDILRGGAGDDTLDGDLGTDTLDGGDGNDILRNGEAASGGPGNDVLEDGGTLNGDAGDDTLRRGVAMNGGDGADVLVAGDLTTAMDGGEGADTLTGTAAGDVLDGGGGDDVLDGGPGRDLMRGGAGTDTATYAAATLGISVDKERSLAQGQGPDGDVLLSVERVVGGAGSDQLLGAAGADILDGGSDGADALNGRGGNDLLVGGPREDGLVGGDGDDTIDARDGVRDRIQCGAGRDAVIADLADPFPFDCETTLKFAVDDGDPSRVVRERLRVTRGGDVLVSLACPRTSRIACRGTLRVGASMRGAALLEGAYEVPRGRTRTVELDASAAVAATLRRRATAVVSQVERGVSKKGPRRTRTLVTIRRVA